VTPKDTSRRGQARIVTMTCYVEQADCAEADQAVREIVARQQ
jgi:hypothetical protein